MSLLETGRQCTRELDECLEWPGVDLRGCVLLAQGVITGIDKPNKTLEYESIESAVEGERRETSILSMSGVELHPPENGAPLDTRQNFWCFFDPHTFKMAILRGSSAYK